MRRAAKKPFLINIKGVVMKKLWLLAGISVLLFFSCTITTKAGIVFDDSIPVEQTTMVHTAYIGKVTGYNGIAVDWNPKLTETIQIPSGDTLLELNIGAMYYGTIYRGKDMLFRYNFQPQKQYVLKFNIEDAVYGLNVHTYEIGEKFSGMQKDFDAHFTAFVPFLNNPTNQKTVLD
jgi:hypothetical protein